ncbi:DUF945 family protein [Gilliamella sp. Pas-s27]|uniref:DUF945 family protein n=1 Tax=Gilliamella sp. Pas-s27 TaxID=2687311 RepID=UPI001365B92F|nr:DUF945 family protein [Gilliamella sp. Pas-s27]MWP46736.1 DUF945 family protein [Gilliamella sp. Pas-s27]
MKKTTLAIGIVAILGIAYVGTAWHTGNIIESNIDNQLALITNKASQVEENLTFSITKSHYEKGIFSTKLHLTVTVSENNSFYGEDATPTTLFDDDVTIHHGPFPIAALAEGTFTPQMAWLEYEMSEQVSPQLWKLAGNQPFITGHVGMSYGEYLTVKLKNKAIEIGQNEVPILNGTLFLGKGSYTFGGYTSGKDISSKIDIDKFSFNHFQLFRADPTLVVVNKFVMNQNVDLNSDTNTVEGAFSSHIDSITYGQHDLGTFSLDFDFQGFDEQLFSYQIGMNYPDSDLDDTGKKHNIRFSLNKFNWKTPAGNINTSFMFDVDSEKNTYSNEDYDKINAFSLKLEAPFDVLATLSAQISNPNIDDITSQIADAKENIQLTSRSIAESYPFLTLNKGKIEGIYSDVSLTKDSDEVKVNNTTVSKEEFFDDL